MKESILKILNIIYLRCLIYIPVFVIIGLGIYYVYLLIFSPFSMERENILFGVDIVAATLAGIIFYASSAAKDLGKKRMYYVDAEKFLHATILMSVAAILEGCVIIIGSNIENNLFKSSVCAVLILATIIFFLLALRYLIQGLLSMMKNMYLKAGIF